MNNWKEFFAIEEQKDYYINLMKLVDKEYEENVVFPAKENIFKAFEYTPLSDVKVVILGQDPYHNKGQSHGLCFSVGHDVKIPPSLRNIFKELNEDIGCYIPNNGYLEKWAKEGILLLNTILTVREKEPGSHKKMGWENFTNNVIKVLNMQNQPIVFILWGNPAREKKKLLNNKNHLILESTHPSPLAAYQGFFGTKPFSKTNEFLQKHKQKIIDWQIENI